MVLLSAVSGLTPYADAAYAEVEGRTASSPLMPHWAIASSICLSVSSPEGKALKYAPSSLGLKADSPVLPEETAFLRATVNFWKAWRRLGRVRSTKSGDEEELQRWMALPSTIK